MPVRHRRASDEHGASSLVFVCRMRASDEHRAPSSILIGHTRASYEHGGFSLVLVRHARVSDEHFPGYGGNGRGSYICRRRSKVTSALLDMAAWGGWAPTGPNGQPTTRPPDTHFGL